MKGVKFCYFMYIFDICKLIWELIREMVMIRWTSLVKNAYCQGRILYLWSGSIEIKSGIVRGIS